MPLNRCASATMHNNASCIQAHCKCNTHHLFAGLRNIWKTSCLLLPHATLHQPLERLKAVMVLDVSNTPPSIPPSPFFPTVRHFCLNAVWSRTRVLKLANTQKNQARMNEMFRRNKYKPSRSPKNVSSHPFDAVC